jgi:DNA polymerase I-like protein with 3'-5' exonuclease and polymerase domains
VQLLIQNTVLGTDQHLLTDSVKASVHWCTKVPSNVWVLGDKNHVNSVETLLAVLGEDPIDMFPNSHLKAFEELCPDGINSNIPWRWVLGDKDFMARLHNTLERVRVNVCALEDSKYDQTYKTIRKFLLELQQPLIDKVKIQNYIHNNTKGMTVEASLRSFLSDNHYAPRITYDQAGTATGRLTVKKGPRILTLPARYRDIIKPERECEIVQIDLVSAEPRTALHVAGKDATGDVYSSIAESLNLDVPRKVVKVASLSALYGAGSTSLAALLGSKSQAKRVINRLREHFGVRRIESQLTADMKKDGYITNIFGRKLMTRRDELQKLYSHFMQSTTSDAAICMFSSLCETLQSHDSNFKPLYVIHDALVCQVSSGLRQQLEDMSKELILEGIGLYETKMTPVNDN